MNMIGKGRFLILMVLTLFFINPSFGKVSNNDSKNEKTVQQIIKEMSLEQKAQLLIGTGRTFSGPMYDMWSNPKGLPVDPEYKEMIERLKQLVPGAAGVTAEFPELGITTQVLADGPAGLRISPQRPGSDETYYCTAFPIATLLASSWDTELVTEVGKAMGNEVLEYGCDVLLAPGMNIQRNPLCGRNFEYYSEDPLVTGKMAAAMVNGIQSNGVGTSIKHFAVNNQETNRYTSNSVVSQRAVREIYLRGFEIAVKESQPWTVMTSYNKINGIYAPQNNDLLTKILRDEWGFEGYVMTDWDSGDNVIEMVVAGNDFVAPGQINTIQDVVNAVLNGELSEEILDRNLANMLRIMLKTPTYSEYEYSSNPDLTAHAQVARQAATDGMVLLENKNGTLPLSGNGKNVAVFGYTSYDFVSGGTGSGNVNEAYTVSLMEGLANGGYMPNEFITDYYQKKLKGDVADDTPDNWSRVRQAEMRVEMSIIEKAADESDFALLTIGRNAGENNDRKDKFGDFYLSSVEKELVKNVYDAFHDVGKKVVVVLNIGGAIETQSWIDWADAVLLAWQPGQEAGNAVLDVLTGKVNPSAKLAVSFPVLYSDVPSSMSFAGKEIKEEEQRELIHYFGSRPLSWEFEYNEDIYVGYRYYNTFNIPVAYEFGYGLSYTNFAYSNLKVSESSFDGEMSLTVDVKNTGKVAGREVVQIYVSAPDGKLEKPEEELASFGKTKLLNPGETETLTFTFDAKEIASFDEETSSWIVEKGDYLLKAAASSTQIKLNETFNVDNDIIVEKVNDALKPVREFDRLSKI